MSVTGRINVSALFHDSDGAASLKVLSLEDSAKYSSGKAALFSGTASTSTVSMASIQYRDAGGSVVTITNPSRAVVSGTPAVRVNFATGHVIARSGQPAVIPLDGSMPTVQSTSGVCSFTMVLHGT
jgi:ABC-type Fe3+-hydroxamate transport system substrate-binding protein